MEVKIKLDTGATMPTYAKPRDAGMDLTVLNVKYDDEKDYIEYDSGVAVEIPEGYVGLVFPRSSISNYDLMLTNAVGVIDSGYRSTIKARFKVITSYEQSHIDTGDLTRGNFGMTIYPIDEIRGTIHYTPVYKIGDRFAQLIIIPYPKVEFKVVDELSTTERGCGGYGSTNN